MKSFACVLLLAVAAVAEPPSYRLSRFKSATQEVERSGNDPSDTQKDAPYPASGFRPSKEFKLPERQELVPPATSYGVPDDSYGAPLNTYAAPQTEYGLPKSSDNEAESVENESSLGDAVTKEKIEKSNFGDTKSEAEVISAQGAYYVLLPGAQLQRVQFQTENDIRNMAYTARLQYRNEDRAPIYLYTAVPQQYQAPPQVSAAYMQPVQQW